MPKVKHGSGWNEDTKPLHVPSVKKQGPSGNQCFDELLEREAEQRKGEIARKALANGQITIEDLLLITGWSFEQFLTLLSPAHRQRLLDLIMGQHVESQLRDGETLKETPKNWQVSKSAKPESAETEHPNACFSKLLSGVWGVQ